MLAMRPPRNATVDDYLKELRRTIRKHGWAVQYVESEKKPFAYTVGLHKCGFSEYLVTGVDPERALRLLNAVANYTCVRFNPRQETSWTSAGKCSSNS